ncbi:glutathione S-transferase 1-like isoform X2 [Vigna unguiculata]|uniref:glutathione S-transferase 1-like isoform X2 n=1 Tax=Vigna unguiculata TaxID=3917 RepID=UPI001016F046|nr:glutathione S-transferase 1-like isoform X2 [Vigna unguiculata]XP_027906312.1 glutathione S-transferase 1-like isoform X2 [Vigna unguiculata]
MHHFHPISSSILTAIALAHGVPALLYASKHLEEKYTQKPLLQVGPQLRALNLQVASIVHSSIQPLHMLSLLKDMEKKFGAESKPWAQFTINKGFSALEKLLKDFAATYASGNVSADVFLVADIEQSVERFGVDMVNPNSLP